MLGPGDLFAQIKARSEEPTEQTGAPSPAGTGTPNPLAAMLKARQSPALPAASKPKSPSTGTKTSFRSGDKPFSFDSTLDAFLFFAENQTPSSFAPTLERDQFGNIDTNIQIPLAPCIYRLTDYTLAKKEPVALQKCILKLGVVRCLLRECHNFNHLLQHRDYHETLEEEELGKVRFMELLSNCGVYQKVSELILQRAGQVLDRLLLLSHDEMPGDGSKNATDADANVYRIPQVRVDGLQDFLDEIEKQYSELEQARKEIAETQTVSFYPGLSELFCPGSKLICHPEGMEGSPLGCSCVQCWYAEELNKATNKVKRRFVLVIEFIVSVGDELVFVAATDVYPEFHDLTRNVPIKDLTHRKLNDESPDDLLLLDRLQWRGEFYASVATKNHYLEYQPDSFFPIIGGGWNSNAVRPLPKGGRVMVDVKRGILEGHVPVRGSSADGLSDTVKEAIKLFEQSKRTGVAVPFRTAILPGFVDNSVEHRGDSDRPQLWQSWPMLSGFSFTARVWGKLLLGMPKPKASQGQNLTRRPSSKRMGVEQAALGGEGSCGNCGYIKFQEQAFDQLVLAEDKKELIRAVARNAGGAANALDDDDDEEEEEIGIDVVANKGGASIFLLHGPPGCGKTLTAEAIAELLRKPLYIVTAGDLGVTAADVEKTLGSVLDLCQTWDALVLIDEADIFLEARNSTEIQRNALVCVMLRLLEYYSGCLFLSSNRAAGSIDAAIASRITVMLGYPALDEEGRTKVWRNLVELVPALPIDPSKALQNPRKAPKYREQFGDSDYQELASKYQLNGRQIKNSIVLARALARERGAPLSMPILHRAVTAVAGEEAAL